MAGAGGGAAATTTNTTSRFAAACGALSRYIKAGQMARAPRPLPLMPGADATTAESREEAEPEPAPSQLTIVYGGSVLVLDDVTADKAAAAARGARTAGRPIAAADLPLARKASLQRFMEKRRGRIAARAEPYLRPLAGADRADELTLAL